MCVCVCVCVCECVCERVCVCVCVCVCSYNSGCVGLDGWGGMSEHHCLYTLYLSFSLTVTILLLLILYRAMSLQLFIAQHKSYLHVF